MTNMLESESLLCSEVLDMSELKTPEKKQTQKFQQIQYPVHMDEEEHQYQTSTKCYLCDCDYKDGDVKARDLIT